MDLESARQAILLHAGHVVVDGKPGLLGRFRPYEGKLDDRDFMEIMNAIIALHPTIHTAELVDRRLVAALWDIQDGIYRYAVDPRGMLQRNRLLNPPDSARVEAWFVAIERAAFHMLCGNNLEACLSRLARYVADLPKDAPLDVVGPYRSFLPSCLTSK